MRISAKAEYACVAVLDLAMAASADRPVRIHDVAARHGIPEEYLAQTMLQLKRAGLLASTRGVGGGYRLARAPADITLGQVVEAIDGPAESPTSDLAAGSAVVRALRAVWQDVARRERVVRDELTFEDLRQRVDESDSGMYYI